MERTYGRHMRSRISQPTIYQLTDWEYQLLPLETWSLDRAFGPNEIFRRSGNRHNRLAAIRRERLSASDQVLQAKLLAVGGRLEDFISEPLPNLSEQQS